MKIKDRSQETRRFRAKAHVLRLLGDELIGSPKLAVFELVKNGYDADATEVTVTLQIKKDKVITTVVDNGHGMSLDVLANHWLVLGSDFKRGDNRKPSPRFKRNPLGEKGVGRLAALKLGNRILLKTRSAGEQGTSIDLDVNKALDGVEDLGDVRVFFNPLDEDTKFLGSETGTSLKIISKGERADEDWTKREVRDLYRMCSTLINPFQTRDDFDIEFDLRDKDDWLEDLPELGDILELASWEFDFSLDENGFFWTYKFNPPQQYKSLQHKELTQDDWPDGNRLQWLPEDKEPGRRPKKSDAIFVDPDKDLEGIGPLSGSFYVFHRRNEVLGVYGNIKQVRMYLESNTGVRIYRDDIRVYNYGERGDDWLDLDTRRINRPAGRMGTNSVIGAVFLDLGTSSGLDEKTNREGFDHNETYSRFRRIIQGVIDHLDTVRMEDRVALVEAIKGRPDVPSAPDFFHETVEKLRGALKKKDVNGPISVMVNDLESSYDNIVEVLSKSGLLGFNISLVYHEIERVLHQLVKDILADRPQDAIKQIARNARELVVGVGHMFKRSQSSTLSAHKLLKDFEEMSRGRFKRHGIKLDCPILEEEDPNFMIEGQWNILLGALSNLLDNAVHWCEYKRERDGKTKMIIAVRTLVDWAEEGPVIVMIDSGPGFSLSNEKAFRPFSGTRPGGMGLGLFYVNLAMQGHGGKAFVVEPESLGLELDVDLAGGCVVLQFPKKKS